jgi:hypothetical protein
MADVDSHHEARSYPWHPSAEPRLALQGARRRSGPEPGFRFFEAFTDDELADQIHHSCFPDLTLIRAPEGLRVFRTEPDAGDPNWSTFVYWYPVPHTEGAIEVATLYGMRTYREAGHETGRIQDYSATIAQVDFVAQDLLLAETQQRELRSMTHKDAHLAGQGTRMRRLHEVLNDYLAGRR